MKTLLLIGAALFLTSTVKLPKSIKDNYTFVPSGNTVVNEKELSVQAFYMFKGEVTNFQYLEFLHHINEHGTEEEKVAARIRTENWVDDYPVSQDKYREHYHKHPAYRDYPVVNVTHEGAQLYCKFLELKLNEILDEKVKVRLPTQAEFIRAGAGDEPQNMYAWGDVYLQEPKGGFRANCLIIRQNQVTRDESGEVKILKPIKIDGSKNANVDLMAPSNSYEAYSFGFHNLNGNVSEMINTPGIAVGGSFRDFGNDIRLQSISEYDGSACHVGFRPFFTVVQ